MAKKEEAEKPPTRETVRASSVRNWTRMINRNLRYIERDHLEVVIEMAATGCASSDELFSRIAEIASDKNRGGLERALDIVKIIEDEDEWFGPRAQMMEVLDKAQG